MSDDAMAQAHSRDMDRDRRLHTAVMGLSAVLDDFEGRRDAQSLKDAYVTLTLERARIVRRWD